MAQEVPVLSAPQQQCPADTAPFADSGERNAGGSGPHRSSPLTTPRPTWLDRRCRALVINWLKGVTTGRLTLIDADGTHTFGSLGSSPHAGELHATLRVLDPRFYRRAVLHGSLGVGEAWRSGWWTSDDLTTVIQLFIRNREAFLAADTGISRVLTGLSWMSHRLRHNSRQNSRRNIAAHYDLGNDFYSLFLDETMTYSAGVFDRPGSTMAEASTAKYERLCRKLELQTGDQVLEVGGGWGGFAVHAASRYGCRVTTTTISAEQHAYLGRRVQEAGLADRVTVLRQDYRDLTGTYDKLVSIEMIEAVGHEYLDTYFKTCAARLKPDGLMALQAITIADQLYDGYRHSVDFIQKYIFPGGCLPSVTTMAQSLTRATDLRVCHLEDLASHYVRTLEEWRGRFFGEIDEIRRQGFDDEFIRTWDYYFCYCAAAFAERQTGLVQMVLAKPRYKSPRL